VSSTVALGVGAPDHRPDLRYGFNAHEWAVLLPLFVGLLDGVWTTRASIGALGAATLAGLVALRGLPETAGSDVIEL
jgi:hypothetical protein